MIEFTVLGVPVPQGSKMPWGAEANPHVHSWRATVADAASKAMPDGVLLGPVRVTATFVFPRPKGHYGSGRNADQLKPSAPHWHIRTPDADKLQRALGDAFKGCVVRDDAQIAAWTVSKVYGHPPCAKIQVEELAQASS